MFRRTAIAAALIATATVAMPAAAQDEPSAVVSYHDLNLATAEGAATLNTRLLRAIGAMCGSADARDLRRSGEVARCRQVANASATGQLALAINNAQQFAARDRGTVRLASR